MKWVTEFLIYLYMFSSVVAVAAVHIRIRLMEERDAER